VLFRGVDKFVFVSQHTRDSFALRVPEKQATVIYDGIDVSALSQLEARASVLREFELPSNARLVGMAARLSPQKDHGTLLRAFREVITEHPDAHLLIIGDVSGSSSAVKIHENLRQLAADLGIGSHVTFAGFRRDISRLLAAMDIVTLVTHFEGLPLVLLEAMAQARPIVATATGGIPELVVHQETGLLHRLQSVSELASHIRLLLQDEAQARRLGEAGRRLVEERFTMERFSANMAGLYRSLLGAPSRVDTSLRSDS
jgi:glycosyltransferase involved in cell wall biosynthesis